MSYAEKIEALIAERDAANLLLVKGVHVASELNSKLAALAAQEPVGYAYAHQDFIGSVIGAKGDWAPHETPLFTAAGAAPVPPGWQLVPVEPTPEMIQYGVSAASCHQTKQSHRDFQRAYKAMLSVAQTINPTSPPSQPV